MKLSRALSVALAAALTGCTTERHITDARHPEVAVTPGGTLEFRGERIEADELPGLLEDAGYTPADTINILIPSDLSDYRLPYRVMGVLSRNGFRRPVLVKERRSYSIAGKDAKDAASTAARTVDGRVKKPAAGPQVVYPQNRRQRAGR